MKIVTHVTCLVLVISSMFGAKGQQVCTDAVHPTNQRASILQCCIRSFSDDNKIVFMRNGIKTEIEAVAVNVNGKFYDLTNSKDSAALQKVLFKRYDGGNYWNESYEYYKYERDKATSNVVLGSCMAVLGTGMVVAGVVNMNRKAQEWPETEVNGQGFLLMLGGAGLIGAGIPIAVKAGNKKRRYQAAMDQVKNKKELTLGPTNHGIGLVLKF